MRVLPGGCLLSTAFEPCPAPPSALAPDHGSRVQAPAPGPGAGFATGARLESAFRHRGALLFLAGAPIAASALSGGTLRGWECALGGGLLAGGVLLRLLCVRFIGKRARVRTSGAARLFCEGPFARVRNPLYIANLQIASGAAVLAGLGPWTFLLAAYVLAVYHLVVQGEEATLRDLFGSRYDVYAARVPRWVPRLSAAQPVEPTPPEPFPWASVLAREGPTMLLGVAAAFGAILYVRLAGPGVPWAEGQLDDLAQRCGLPLWGLAATLVTAGAIVEGVVTDWKRRRHERARAALAGRA